LVNRYTATRCLSGTLNLFFRTGIRDAHCGMRGFRRDILPVLEPAHHRDGVRLRGWSSELEEKLDIREFPIEYHPRGGESKLSRFRDGWRHLRFCSSTARRTCHRARSDAAAPGSEHHGHIG